MEQLGPEIMIQRGLNSSPYPDDPMLSLGRRQGTLSEAMHMERAGETVTDAAQPVAVAGSAFERMHRGLPTPR